jgi:dTDP-4-dehydrorhamnose 3,5-epimerase-like enzyme
MKASLQQGSKYTDERGILQFVNETNPGNYRRFYFITHTNTNIVRAWQGHKMEEKAFYTINGSFIIAVVNPKCFEIPADVEIPDFFELNEKNNHFLRVPGGSYTGIKALSPNSTLLVLSGFDFSSSKADDYRQPAHKWVDWDTIK